MKIHDCNNSESGEGRASAELIAQCAVDVTPEPVEWLWAARIALGKLTLIAGEPGLGKSQVSIAMAAAITTGGDLPCSEGRALQGSVVILSAEDGVADTIVPRLMAAGAEREHVQIIRAVKDPTGRRGFNLAADLDLLEKEIDRLGDVRLVIIDPISSYLGTRVDSHVNASVRGVLEPVSEIAARLRIAIVAITHQPKGTGAAAIHRFIGSIAFVAAARSAHLVISDPEDKDRRLFLPVKNNLAPLGKGLAFRLEQRLVGDPGQGIVASSVVWESEPVTISADQALRAADDQGIGGGAGTDAEEFLREVLAAGPVSVKDIQAEAKAAGHSWATVRRAKERLKVVSEYVSQGRNDGGRFGEGGYWLWRLPSQPSTRDAQPHRDAHSQEKSTSVQNEQFGFDTSLPSHPQIMNIFNENEHRSTRDAHPLHRDAQPSNGNAHFKEMSTSVHPVEKAVSTQGRPTDDPVVTDNQVPPVTDNQVSAVPAVSASKTEISGNGHDAAPADPGPMPDFLVRATKSDATNGRGDTSPALAPDAPEEPWALSDAVPETMQPAADATTLHEMPADLSEQQRQDAERYFARWGNHARACGWTAAQQDRLIRQIEGREVKQLTDTQALAGNKVFYRSQLGM